MLFKALIHSADEGVHVPRKGHGQIVGVPLAHCKAEDGLDLVIITDLDFVSDLAFQQEEELDQQVGQKLDNVSFLLNAIEVLGGPDDFFQLRNRRQWAIELRTSVVAPSIAVV